MEKCQTASLEHVPDPQQTTVNEKPCPFFSSTTPDWGDRNASEQPAEETNNNLGSSFSHLIPSTSDLKISTNNLSPSKNSNLTDNTINNQWSSDGTQLPRQCKLCAYIAMDRTEYIDHIISHCTFQKDTYVENIHVNGHVDDEESDEYGNESLGRGKKRPKLPRPKLCSKCEYVAKTKLMLWLHLRQHFLQEECSGFVCALCAFATTFKHHMTFHWFSAHDDFKGFMCAKCRYTCVSKSMLTSHMKTHSEVYQYNCGSCSYRTKFCNAMKKHLKDNLHVAGPVLNPDGTPNPFATIDVYGSKRGPRRKPFEKELTEINEDRPTTSRIIPSVPTVPTSSVSSSPISSIAISDSPDSKALMSPSPTPLTPIPLFHSNSLDRFKELPYPFHSNRVNNENGIDPSIDSIPTEQIPNNSFESFAMLCQMLLSDMETRPNLDNEERGQIFRLLRNAQEYLFEHKTIEATNTNEELSDNATIDKPSTPTFIDESSTCTTPISSQLKVKESGVPDEPLDLSISGMSKTKNQPQFQESVASSSSRRSKRKRKATKLEYLMINEDTNDSETQTENTNQTNTESFLPELLTTSQSDLQRRNETLDAAHNANIYNSSFICYYCRIIFANEIMYAVHMSFHSTKNHLICALCNRKSANITAFFLHLIRTKH